VIGKLLFLGLGVVTRMIYYFFSLTTEHMGRDRERRMGTTREILVLGLDITRYLEI
jgi:hypothetical protein